MSQSKGYHVFTHNSVTHTSALSAVIPDTFYSFQADTTFSVRSIIEIIRMLDEEVGV